MSSTKEQTVVCAALRHARTGRIICGARHFDPIMRAQIAASEGVDQWRGAEQGFIDQRGNFLTREEALALAIRNGQMRHRCGGDTVRLYSENLY